MNERSPAPWSAPPCSAPIPYRHRPIRHGRSRSSCRSRPAGHRCADARAGRAHACHARQHLVVENVTGAAGTIGVARVARATRRLHAERRPLEHARHQRRDLPADLRPAQGPRARLAAHPLPDAAGRQERDPGEGREGIHRLGTREPGQGLGGQHRRRQRGACRRRQLPEADRPEVHTWPIAARRPRSRK